MPITKPFELTKEEYDIIMAALEAQEYLHQDRSRKPGDGEDLEASRLARVQNELLWQHARGKRRPVQH